MADETVNELEDCCGTVVVGCCCEKLVAEAGKSSETQGRSPPLPLEAVTRTLVKTQEA
jgi:hypothetical protein